MFYILLLTSIVIGFFTCVLANIKYRSWINHYSLMNGWWCFILYVSYFSSWYSVAFDTYLVFFGGLFFFNATILYFPWPQSKYIKNELFLSLKQRRLVELLVFILLIPFLKELYTNFSSGMELWLIRKALRTGDIERSYIISSLLLYIVTPLVTYLMITSYYNFYNTSTSKTNRISLVISLIFVLIIGTADGGGRSVLMSWFFMYILCVAFNLNDSNGLVMNANSRFNLYIFLLPIIGIGIMTILRGASASDQGDGILFTLRMANTHFIGLFDFYLHNPDIAGFNNNTFGISTFEGFFFLINYPFRIIFQEQGYLFDYLTVNSIIQQPREVNGIIVNAQVSMYFRFIRDWSYAGVLIGPTLLAFLFHSLYSFGIRNSYFFLLYVYSLTLIINTSNDLIFSNETFILTILYYYVMRYKFVKS